MMIEGVFSSSACQVEGDVGQFDLAFDVRRNVSRETFWSIGAAGAQVPYKHKVGGSNPSSTTMILRRGLELSGPRFCFPVCLSGPRPAPCFPPQAARLYAPLCRWGQTPESLAVLWARAFEGVRIASFSFPFLRLFCDFPFPFRRLFYDFPTAFVRRFCGLRATL